jgi:hypothetical protein
LTIFPETKSIRCNLRSHSLYSFQICFGTIWKLISSKYLRIMMEWNPEAVIFMKAIRGSGSVVPYILGLTAIAIELYTSSAAKFLYFFVHYLMPICLFRSRIGGQGKWPVVSVHNNPRSSCENGQPFTGIWAAIKSDDHLRSPHPDP